MTDLRTTAKSALATARDRLQPYWLRLRAWAARLPGGERTLWIASGLVLLALLLWAIQPSGEVRGGRFGRGGPMPVGIAKAEPHDIAITINALGTVTPLATVTVKPQVAGTLMQIYFTEGGMVTAGDVLAEIDPRTYKAAFDQANGQLLRDQAQLANAKLDLQRYRTLLTQNSIAKQQVDTQAALVRQYEATVKTDEATVESAAINLGYCRIVSPVSGRVGLRQVDVGNIVEPATTSGIVVVTQLQPISVLFSVPEDSINAIMQRLAGGATLAVDAFDRSQSKKLAAGALSTVDNQIDPATGTVKLRAMFDNNDAGLFPNQFVNVRLLVNTVHAQTALPSAAIQRGASGTFVFVINPDSTAHMRGVVLGPSDGTRVAIARGLKPGETVVIDGADRLRDGGPVLLPGAKLPAEGASRRDGDGGRRQGRGRRSQSGGQ